MLLLVQGLGWFGASSLEFGGFRGMLRGFKSLKQLLQAGFDDDSTVFLGGFCFFLGLFLVLQDLKASRVGLGLFCAVLGLAVGFSGFRSPNRQRSLRGMGLGTTGPKPPNRYQLGTCRNHTNLRQAAQKPASSHKQRALALTTACILGALLSHCRFWIYFTCLKGGFALEHPSCPKP